MSLFGDDDPPSSRANKSSLFDEEPTAPSKGGSSMFDDTPADNEASPWGFTPKKNTGRGNLVKSLLADADVPELYVDTFDGLQTAGQVKKEDAQKLLRESGVSGADQTKIWQFVSSGSDITSLSRSEFSVLLALTGLAQEGEELGLDAVDERRTRLPTPNLPNAAPKTPKPSVAAHTQTPAQQTALTADSGSSFEGPRNGMSASYENDPWGSPSLHRNHGHANGDAVPQRTTSNFTTASIEPAESTAASQYSTIQSSAGSVGDSWGAPPDTSNFGASGHPSATGGFGGESHEQTPSRPRAQPRTTTSNGTEEIVTVSLLDEKEGMFMFQHRNYEVASIRRNSKVIRRYSDFVWLLDCLHKRYPFRQLPLLPPKRVAINGNHLAADNLFLEKRRRGLVRFSNALVRHPILREEQLVVMFLTVPTELTVWRKQATISVQEEFTGRVLPPNLEDSLPADLPTTFETIRAGVRRSADLYINMCNILERLCKRAEATAVEYGRLNHNLVALTEASAETYALDTNDVPLLNEGVKATASHLATSQNLLDDEARAWDQGVLEDAKGLRDALVSMRDLFDRRERLARDNILALEKRITQNETKLQGIKAKGELAKPGEVEKVENAIVADKQSIVDQHARGVFIKECVRDEIVHFQTTQFRVTRLHQDWAQERVKYAELQADNWRAMVDAVESMPLEG